MTEDDLDLIDDDSRTCEVCGDRYPDHAGQTCTTCDIWICVNCQPDHVHETPTTTETS